MPLTPGPGGRTLGRIRCTTVPNCSRPATQCADTTARGKTSAPIPESVHPKLASNACPHPAQIRAAGDGTGQRSFSVHHTRKEPGLEITNSMTGMAALAMGNHLEYDWTSAGYRVPTMINLDLEVPSWNRPATKWGMAYPAIPQRKAQSTSRFRPSMQV
jgi:hypothetical protein